MTKLGYGVEVREHYPIYLCNLNCAVRSRRDIAEKMEAAGLSMSNQNNVVRQGRISFFTTCSGIMQGCIKNKTYNLILFAPRFI